jgi:hypothetical protein
VILESFSEKELILAVVIEHLVLVEGLYADLVIHVHFAQLLHLPHSILELGALVQYGLNVAA